MNFDQISAALPNITSRPSRPALPRIASGKVREIFDLGDALLLVATDRLSAFDVILPDGIPGKGIVLTQMSNWCLRRPRSSSRTTCCRPAGRVARRGIKDRDLQLRSMIVRKLKPLPIECVARATHRQRLELLPEDRRGVRHQAARRPAASRPSARAYFHPDHEGPKGSMTNPSTMPRELPSSAPNFTPK